MEINDRFVFMVEWYDQLADLSRKYQLTYFTADATIEMVRLTQYDIKNRRPFLKRCQYPALTLAELHVGATVTVYSRQLKVVDYGDTYTEKQVYSQLTRTFGMIKPDCYSQIGKILDRIYDEGLKISKLRMIKLTQGQVREFYREHQGKPFYEALVKHIASDVVVGLEIAGEDSVRR